MKEVLITSTVLILALLLLRRLARNAIPRRVQYALWGLVLLRLLIPAGLLPKSGFSVLTAARPVEERVAVRMEEQPAYVLPVRTDPFPVIQEEIRPLPEGAAAFTGHPVVSDDNSTVTLYAFTAAEALNLVWKAGMVLMACWFLFTNLRFWLRLRKHRTPFSVEGCKRPVWLVENGELRSPCLFGLFRPAIYLPPAAAASPETLRHVLAHEETHARHLDPLWSLLRGVCLAVYWFDPLVWWAALASRNDCELACDEGAIRRLGEGERIPYGRTLLSLIPVGTAPADPLLSATTMTSGKRQLKERVTRIAEHPRTAAAALLAVAAIAALVCALTFTAASGKPKLESLTAEELQGFSDIFNGGEGEHLNLLLIPDYKKPADFDAHLLLHGAASLRAGVSEEEYAALAARGLDGDRFKVNYLNFSQMPSRYFDLGVSMEDCLQDPEYLEEYDAWFPVLQAPCAPVDITFYSGERGNGKEGSFVRLYYKDEPDPTGQTLHNGWYCVTLLTNRKEGFGWSAGDGSCLIVSNLPCKASAVPEPPARSLTAADLKFFNEEFFNRPGNSTLSLFLVPEYERPEDFDATFLICGASDLWEDVTEEEYDAIAAMQEGGTDGWRGSRFRVARAGVEEVLQTCMGLSLSDLSRDYTQDPDFLADAQFDAWYPAPQEPLHPGEITFSAGERAGDLVRLYYDLHNSWYCVTLRENGDGGWWFVSNLPCQEPTFSVTVLPQGDPYLTIPLEGTPYQAPETKLTSYTGEYQEMLTGWQVLNTKYSLCVWRGTDGDIYYGAQPSVISAWPETYFLRINYDAQPDALQCEPFQNDLLGEGLVLTYPVMAGTRMHAYYSFDENGVPSLLFQTTGHVEEADLSGSALTWDPLGAELPGHHLLYRRDGQLYEADLAALLLEADKELLSLDYTAWGPDSLLFAYGYTDLPGGGGRQATVCRQIYLEGDTLLVYREPKIFEGHVAAGLEAPYEVLEAARNYVQEVFQTSEQGSIFQDGEFYPAQVEYDDWRIESLVESDTITAGPWTVSAWTLTYALHTTTPDRVSMAGARTITEDCWVNDNYPIVCLFFLLNEDGRYVHLYDSIAGGSFIDTGAPGTEDFHAAVLRQLEKMGLITAQDAPYYVDHVSAYIDAPADVLRTAMTWAQDALEHRQQAKNNPGSVLHPDVYYDGWRIESLDGPWYEEIDGLNIEIWQMSFHLHTSDPPQDGTIDGHQIEGGWVDPDETVVNYLYFLASESGARTWLTWCDFPENLPGTEAFREHLIQDLQLLDLFPADG